ncbi:hypothetical protein RBA41_17350 [Massilia sp. CCM 9210]|uniref:hypothetical protein n=1 Tax=Massilia scottii TaxID=3057166 RepID=UPI002796DB96|nr:hypothetical protein [Massilia sp. CCM 9210]MDQ1815066.1 hypothetical protein [Massilia sp. CCM 9210]
MGVTSAKDLANEIPYVTFQATGDSAVQITIRGVTSSNTTEIGAPAVGFHIDGLSSCLFPARNMAVDFCPHGKVCLDDSTCGFFIAEKLCKL